MRIQYLVIHCTATPEGRKVSADNIREWHTSPKPKGRGWRQVGYSDMVHLDGTVENLVPYNDDDIVDAWEITNGAKGINGVSRHVVYVGGCDNKMNPKDTRTPEQLEALKQYVDKVLKLYPFIKIAGHNQFASKACPSFDVNTWMKETFDNRILKNLIK